MAIIGPSRTNVQSPGELDPEAAAELYALRPAERYAFARRAVLHQLRLGRRGRALAPAADGALAVPSACAAYRVGCLPSGTPVPEHELIERARSGDEDAFAELVAIHADRVYGALRRFGLDAAEAEDVAQEVFLRAWRGLSGFQGRAELSTWLYRIAFNEAQRRLSRRGPPTVGPDSEGTDRVAAIPEASQLGPEARTLDREFEALLEHALAELPAEWRAAVVLRDIEGLSTDEAASVVGIRQAAFKSRLHRGRMQLRALLEPYLELEQG